jgi:hypothetical protein
MADKNLYCSSLLVKIGDITNLKTKYEDKLDQASDDFEFRRDMEIYKDISNTNILYIETIVWDTKILYHHFLDKTITKYF